MWHEKITNHIPEQQVKFHVAVNIVEKNRLSKNISIQEV